MVQGLIHSTVICATLALMSGCTRVDLSGQSDPFHETDRETKIVILLDLSGSFQQMMVVDGKAYQFCLRVADKYFRSRIGTQDEIVIAQISGTDRALLWQGTPAQLRRDFPGPTEFQQFLQHKAGPGGSLVYDSIASTVEYLISEPEIDTGTARSAVFVLSDMLENGPDPETSKNRMMNAFATYGKHHGCVGLYFVDQGLVTYWRDEMKSSGVVHAVAADVGNPSLPDLEFGY